LKVFILLEGFYRSLKDKEGRIKRWFMLVKRREGGEVYFEEG